MVLLAAVLLAGDVEPLLRALAADDIEARSEAAAALRALLPGAEPFLRERLAHPDPEVRGRCRDILRLRPVLPVAKIAFVEPRTGLLAADLRALRNAREGTAFDVVREGRIIGRAVVREVHPWGSWLERLEGAPPLRWDGLRPSDP